MLPSECWFFCTYRIFLYACCWVILTAPFFTMDINEASLPRIMGGMSSASIPTTLPSPFVLRESLQTSPGDTEVCKTVTLSLQQISCITRDLWKYYSSFEGNSLILFLILLIMKITTMFLSRISHFGRRKKMICWRKSCNHMKCVNPLKISTYIILDKLQKSCTLIICWVLIKPICEYIVTVIIDGFFYVFSVYILRNGIYSHPNDTSDYETKIQNDNNFPFPQICSSWFQDTGAEP